ncbi:hypothetical protein G5V59_21330 [Nocardioides sp. W3-2-3]|uniref:hypothetical protein n=1 Tax=Nocardioides convexus TaxID=2712224 RepID=UPI0024184CC7|nr:hypothetical protein [Nocardioides convexus]NHA01485.1 hypothetical protein [Nocardioides convexus]
MVLRWSHSGRPGAESFEVREAGGGRVATLRDGDRRELRLDGGVPRTPTAWTVTAINGRERAVSAPSNEIPDDGAPAEFAAPVSVLATAEPGGKVRLSWSHGGEVAAEHFRVERSGGVVLAQDLAADDRDYVDDAAPLGKPVTYVVTAIRGKERAPSAASNPVTPAEAPAPLAAPASVVATPLGDGTVHLTWTHAGSTPAGQFTIATGAGTDVTPSAGVAGGAREATVTAPLGTPVTFVVTAVNGDQRVASAPSNEVTPARDPDPISAPTGVTATAQSNGTVRVTWTHSGTAAAEFVVNGGGRELGTGQRHRARGRRQRHRRRHARHLHRHGGARQPDPHQRRIQRRDDQQPARRPAQRPGERRADQHHQDLPGQGDRHLGHRSRQRLAHHHLRRDDRRRRPRRAHRAGHRGPAHGDRDVQPATTSTTSCGSLGEDFVATVTATNAFGTGPAGSNQTDLPPPPQPGAPPNVRASGDFQRTGNPLYADGTCTMSVTWGAAPDNGYPIEGYDITFGEGASAITKSTNGAGRDASATKDCEAGNGAQDFTVTVRARNSSATGPAASATGTLSTGGRWTCWPDPPVGPGQQCR